MMHWVARRPLPVGSFPVCLHGSVKQAGRHLETNREELPAELNYFRRKSPTEGSFSSGTGPGVKNCNCFPNQKSQ